MIIEVDKYKEKILGYTPENSEFFHKESGQLADRDFVNCLKSQKYTNIIFMAGGTASGKTEFAGTYLNKKTNLVYDGTLKSFDGFIVKQQKISRYSKNNPKNKIVFILPKEWLKAFQAFLARERKMHPNVFFNTHVSSLQTISRILSETKNRVEIYISDVKEETDKLSFIRIRLSNNRKNIAKNLLEYSKFLEESAKNSGFDING